MNPTSNAAQNPEFTTTRRFDVPREFVWRAWTEESELAQWLHPFGVSTESVSFDVRVGGTYRYMMVNDESGEEYPTGGEFLEVQALDRLVFTWGEAGGLVDAAPIIMLTFLSEGERTELIFHLRGSAGEPGDGFVYGGWAETLPNVGKHLAGEPL